MLEIRNKDRKHYRIYVGKTTQEKYDLAPTMRYMLDAGKQPETVHIR